MIPITKPWLDTAETEAVKETILSGWIMQGTKVQKFEQDFAHYTGAHYACAVSSGTSALHLALLAVGVHPGDVVLTVSHSYIATANSVRYCQAEPVFIDIDQDDYNLDARVLKQCLEEDCESTNGTLRYRYTHNLSVGDSPLVYVKNPQGRIAAILVVHQLGFPCDLKNILALAEAYELPVIEDAACALGSEISFNQDEGWEKIGRPHGDIACFSFHPRKVITTGEGGMLTTNVESYIQQLRLMRNQGMDYSATTRHTNSKIHFETHSTPGFNYRMTDLQAAIGIEQLKKLDTILEKRYEVAQKYLKHLKQIPYLKPVPIKSYARPNWQSYPVQIRSEAKFSQFDLMQSLRDEGVAARSGITNAHQEEPYRLQNWSLPASESAYQRTLLLPLFPNLSESDFEMIIQALVKQT